MLLVSLTGVLAADTLTRQVPLSASELLTLELPSQFRLAVVKESADEFRPAIRLCVTNGNGSYRVVFKIFAGKLLDSGPQKQEDLDAAVRKMGAVYAAASVEMTNAVHDLKLPQEGSLGAYGTFTDASLVSVIQPPPDQYRVITVGLVRIGGYLFTIRGGSGDKHGEDYKAALGILAGLKVETKPADDSQPVQQL